MTGFFELDTWGEWIRALDTAWLFLLIMGLVVAVVVVWSSSLRPDPGEPEDDEART